jgi:hypothetical protein
VSLTCRLVRDMSANDGLKSRDEPHLYFAAIIFILFIF